MSIGDVGWEVGVAMDSVTGKCVSICVDDTTPTRAGGAVAGGCETNGEFLAAFGLSGTGIEADDVDERQAPFTTVPVFQGADGQLADISGVSLVVGTMVPKGWLISGRDAGIEPSKLDFSTGAQTKKKTNHCFLNPDRGKKQVEE